jgi:4'-phosphopantetheinyl transferase
MSSPNARSPGPLKQGVLYLYRARLDTPPVAPTDLIGLLSEAETERNARFHFDRDRRRHRTSTGLLRILLGRLRTADPADLVFQVGPHGKPELPEGPSFNVSHSGEWWFCGVALDGRVGVDVEVHRPLADLVDLARATFHADEAGDVLARPSDSSRRDAFFRVWSRKEAFIKAVGMGLAYPLDGFVVSAEDQPDRVLIEVADPDHRAGGWHMESVTWEPGLAAAVAWDRPGARVEWRPFPVGAA